MYESEAWIKNRLIKKNRARKEYLAGKKQRVGA